MNPKWPGHLSVKKATKIIGVAGLALLLGGCPPSFKSHSSTDCRADADGGASGEGNADGAGITGTGHGRSGCTTDTTVETAQRKR